MNIKEPMVIKDILSKEDFKALQDYVKGLNKEQAGFSDQFNRYEFGGDDILNSLHQKLIPIAKEYFENQSIVPSFNFGSWYFGEASLEKHKDVSPCTFSIDMCVYQKTPWDLYIEDKAYTLQENEAVLYYGEDQKHWREEFPDPENNVVCNVFFFFVEPDHWSLVYPPEMHDEIRFKNSMLRNAGG